MNKASEQLVELPDEAATLSLGERLAHSRRTPAVIFLRGPLGAGKTTLVRGLLRGLEYDGRVKSPTFTLVEPYALVAVQVYHFDLYRLGDPLELEYLGFRDFFAGDTLCLIEWPEKGADLLPQPDLSIQLSPHGEGRRARLVAASPTGASYLSAAVAANI